MSTPQSWSGGSGRQADEVGWGRKVAEMGQGTDKDRKGKKGGRTMTQSSSTLLGLHPLFCMQPKAVVCSAIPPILTLVAGMSLAHGKSIWPSWDVYPGGPMHYSVGTLGPSTLRCGLGQVKVVPDEG